MSASAPGSDPASVERSLTAILAADVVGYSALMGRDEAGTLGRVTSALNDTVRPLIDRHGGRIVKLMGDGVLAAFPSIVAAVDCAVAWQTAMATGDSGLQFRIGVNLGDVIRQDGDIFGDGVNIAARLETLAAPGGICVSSIVHDSLGGRGSALFADCGLHRFKNIDRPVQVFSWPEAIATVQEQPSAPAPERPSVAVLPLVNMSGDAEQSYFSDGISEDIITLLSRFRTFDVLARNSSFALRGEALDAREIGRRLGAEYIVEGSVRRAGGKVRITAQLVDARSGNQLWADRYDRDMDDLFAVQDDVARSIVAILPGRVQDDVALRAARKPQAEMQAHELMLQAKSLRDTLDPEDILQARALLEKAVMLDPTHARAHMYLADTYILDRMLGVARDEDASKPMEISLRGVRLDDDDVYIQDQLGFAYLHEGLWDEAGIQFEKTLAQITNEAESMGWCGYAFMLLGRHDIAQQTVSRALALDPLHKPAMDWVYGQVCYCSGDYDGALRSFMGNGMLNSLANAFVAAAYAQTDRSTEATQALQGFIARRSAELGSRGIRVTAANAETLLHGFRALWRRPEDWAHLLEGLRKAGLPE